MASIQQLGHLKIPLEDIKLATNDFSDSNVIGRGGFGRVYKGHLPLSTSTSPSTSTKPAEVAVKRLEVKEGQGQGQGQPQFLVEIGMLSSYKHDNLVSLIGFCEEGGEKIIVYKHEAHGSLDKHLHTDLTWVQRLHICIGAARGLYYLHEGVGEGHRVLHRDIKSSNILLDENWEAKVSDFGLSKIGATNQEFTFLVTAVAGTIGYVDPIYMSSGVFTKESDVYSFGLVLFEVLCGRLAINRNLDNESQSLGSLAKLRYEEGKLDEIIIPKLRNQMKPSSLQTFSKVAYQCLKLEQKQRPTMAVIMEQLQLSLELQIGGCKRITRIGLWGSSSGGSPWSFRLDGYQKLRKITIDHEDWIYSITFTTQDFSGSFVSSKRHGGDGGRSGGQITEINLQADEEITGIDGTVGVSTGRNRGFIVISSLCFRTNKTDSFGPFGKETGDRFTVPWDVGSFAGFYGRAGFFLDGLGCYLKPTIM